MSLSGLYRHLWSALAAGDMADLDSAPSPRGPEFIFEITDGLGLAEGARILDLGCGPGEQAVQLAGRHGVRPICVDPLLEQLRAARAGAEQGAVEIRGFAGRMEELAMAGESIDLVWLRDALLHATDVPGTARECHRVLRPGGHLLLHGAYRTDRLSAPELALLVENMEVEADSLDRERVDRAFTAVGFQVVREEELGSELAEHYELLDGLGSRALLRLARLERHPEESRRQLGDERFRAVRGIYHWIVFELLGKLSYGTQLLRKSG